MKEGQEAIYYGCGRTVEAIDALPQADQIKEAGYEMLYMTGQVDEFAIKTLREYDVKKFLNIRTDEIDLSTEEQKKALAEENEAAADLFAAMKEALGEKVVDRCQLNGMEVSEADFNTWYEENMTNDVTWYASDGAVIPENM